MSGDDVTSEPAKKSNTATTTTTAADVAREDRETSPQVSSISSKPELKTELDDFGLPVRPRRTPVVVSEEGGSSEHEIREKSGEEVTEQNGSGKGKTQDKADGKITSNEAQQQHGQKEPVQENSGDSTRGRRSRHNSSVGDTQEKSTSTPDPKGKEPDISHVRNSIITASPEKHQNTASEWSHQVLAPQADKEDDVEAEEKWETMPAYAPFDIYDDNNKLIAREQEDSGDEVLEYGTLGGAGKGYTRVQLDDDAQSVTSMDDNTAYLFKEPGTNVADEDDDLRDAMSQMQATKELLTEGQRIAYVGIVRLAMIEMVKDADALEHTRGAKKVVELAVEALKMWSQKMMVRLYSHMEVETAGQQFQEILISYYR
jgi:hypothetical protein